jgi:signal peptidase I
MEQNPNQTEPNSKIQSSEAPADSSPASAETLIPSAPMHEVIAAQPAGSQAVPVTEGASPDLKTEVWEWTKAIAVAIVLVVMVQTFLVTPFIVSGASMEPNFHDHERMLVNKLIYRFAEPERGEVVVFLHSDGRDFIKRVIGVAGDTVRVEGDQVFINDVPYREPFLEEIYTLRRQNNEVWNIKDSADYIVPPGHVFVMGDNRSDSLDSRDIGAVETSRIVGRSDLIYWPLSNFHVVQHTPLEPVTK